MLFRSPKPQEKTAVAVPTDCPYKQILVYCLFMVLKGIGVCLGAAAFLWAADTAGLQTSGSQVYTVRVDPGTGKLVRVPAKRYSRSVASKAVSSKPVAAVSQPGKEVKPRTVEPQEAGAEPARSEPVNQPIYNVVAGRSLDRLIGQVAWDHQIDPRFVHAVIKAESNYNPRAISPKGALGLMQLTRQTAQRFGVTNVFNPAENLEGGVRYLRYLLDLYEPVGRANQTRLSLAAYNAGEGAVDRFRGVPPYWETRQYVRRVSELWNRYQKVIPNPAPAPAPKKLEGPRIIRIEEPSGVTRYVTQSQ